MHKHIYKRNSRKRTHMQASTLVYSTTYSTDCVKIVAFFLIILWHLAAAAAHVGGSGVVRGMCLNNFASFWHLNCALDVCSLVCVCLCGNLRYC